VQDITATPGIATHVSLMHRFTILPLTPGPKASGIINLLDEPLRDVVTWLNPVAGAILVVLALLNYLQENPRHRGQLMNSDSTFSLNAHPFALTDMWDRASFLLKVAGGIILALTTIFHAKYPFRLTSRTGVAWTLASFAPFFI